MRGSGAAFTSGAVFTSGVMFTSGAVFTCGALDALFVTRSCAGVAEVTGASLAGQWRQPNRVRLTANAKLQVRRRSLLPPLCSSIVRSIDPIGVQVPLVLLGE